MIYPKEIARLSSQAHFSAHSTRSRAIYLTVLCFALFLLLLLPWIRVEVGIRTAGMIRPEVERITLRTPAEGVVKKVPHRENSRLQAHDTVMVIHPGPLTEEVSRTETRIKQLREYLQDLQTIKSAGNLSDTLLYSIHSARYRHALLESLRRRDEAREDIAARRRTHERNRVLAFSDLISKSEADESRYLLEKSLLRMQILKREQLHLWTLEGDRFIHELQELETVLERLQRELEYHVIRAPLSGSLQSISAIRPGSYVSRNQVIAEISPDTDLLAELYIPPDKIGLIHEGMPVRIRLDAFDQREWGALNGWVSEIPDDITPASQEPLFNVRCRLERSWLELPDGFRGEIRKGMTLQARLILAERTLFQLLFDRVDDWLNPSWSAAMQTSGKPLAYQP